MADESRDVAGRAEALAAAVGLITARRTGMENEDFGRLVGETVVETLQSDTPFERLGWLIGHLATAAAHACDRWNEAAGNDQADTWLRGAAAVAVEQRS